MFCATEGTPPFGVDANAIALLYRIANNPAPAPTHAGPLTDLITRLLSTDPSQRPSAQQAEIALLARAAPPAASGSTNRNRLLLGALVLAVLVTVGVLVAVALQPGTESAAPPPARTSTRPPTTTTAPPTTTTTTTAPTTTTTTTTSADPAGQLGAAIVDYYQLMPGNLSSAWNHLTADYQQNHAGGMSGYQSFWQPIAGVTVTDVTAAPPSSVTATISYHYRDGHLVVERTQFGLVQQDGQWKIASSSVLSHSGSP